MRIPDGFIFTLKERPACLFKVQGLSRGIYRCEDLKSKPIKWIYPFFQYDLEELIGSKFKLEKDIETWLKAE